MKTVILAVGLLTLCGFTSAEPQDKVTLVSENLIKNPDFSKGNDFPDDWSMMLTSPDVFNVKWIHDANNGNYIYLESLGADYSGYIMQKVKVKKGVWYRLKVCLNHSMGRGLIWLYGYDGDNKPLLFDHRKYLSSFVGNPLVPHFVRKELMNGSEDASWRDEIFDFQNSDDKGNIQPSILRVAVGIYFTNAKIMIKSIEMWEIKKMGSKEK